jgi:hypothetical protein
MAEDELDCGNCNHTVSRADAVRTKTYGGLDPDRWQSLCCPRCGRKLKTVYVGDRL